MARRTRSRPIVRTAVSPEFAAPPALDRPALVDTGVWTWVRDRRFPHLADWFNHQVAAGRVLVCDLVILEPRPPVPGDIVAALIDGETTLKRYLTKNGAAFLKAENPAFPDLHPAEELIIQGVMVALIRRLRAES